MKKILTVLKLTQKEQTSMKVSARGLGNGFTEHEISKCWTTWYEGGSLRVGGGIDIKHLYSADVSPCGKYWCHISNYAPHAVVIVEGLTTERALYEPKDLKLNRVHFTPHLTIFVKHESDTSITELDLDGNIKRHIFITQPWNAVACTKRHVVVSTRNSLESYEYASGKHVYSYAIHDVLSYSLLYSPFTNKLYMQSAEQKGVDAFCIDEHGVITAAPLRIPFPTTPIGSSHWCVVGDDELVVLDDYAHRGICFRDMRLRCEEYGIANIRVIPGGFFIFKAMSVYFITDNFTYSAREKLIRALVM